MKETLLLYHVADDVQKDIKNIAEQLHIQIQYLDESQLHETMGHILNMDLKNLKYRIFLVIFNKSLFFLQE